jgi:hypothetical protein
MPRFEHCAVRRAEAESPFGVGDELALERHAAPSTEAPAAFTTSPVYSIAGVRAISMPAIARPGSASNAIGLCPSAGAYGRYPSAVAIAST